MWKISWKRYRMQKQGILDVLVELNNKTKINIEMQTTFVNCWDRRNLFYLSKMYTEDLRMIQARNIGIKTAIEEIKRMSLSKRLRYHYEAYWKVKRDAWAIAEYQEEQKQKFEMEMEEKFQQMEALNQKLERKRSELEEVEKKLEDSKNSDKIE